MTQFEGETETEYFGRRLRAMIDGGVGVTLSDVLDGFQAFDAPVADVESCLDRIERLARARRAAWHRGHWSNQVARD